MFFLFRPCTLEMDYAAYVRFLLQHHDELNLPYPFAVKLGFLSSPLIFGKAMLILSEEPYEVIGAAGFVYGTGSNQYEDRHIVQVEAAFIQQAFRRTSLFAQGLQRLVEEMKAGNPDVEQVQFWVPANNEGLEKLFARFAALPGSKRSLVNDLALYTIPFCEMEAYSGRIYARLGL